MKRIVKKAFRSAGKKRHAQSRKSVRVLAPQSAEEFFSKSEQFQDSWNRVVHAISRIRADRF
jgi:hypothetical protein